MGRQALSAAEKQARLLKIFSGENKAKQHFFNKAELEKIGDKEHKSKKTPDLLDHLNHQIDQVQGI